MCFAGGLKAASKAHPHPSLPKEEMDVGCALLEEDIVVRHSPLGAVFIDCFFEAINERRTTIG